MKFTVDLEDFWMEEDGGNIQEQMKDHIIHQIKTKCFNDIREQVKKEIEFEVKKRVEDELKYEIQKSVSEIIESETMTYSGVQYTIKDYIKYQFERNSGYSSPNDKITGLAKQFGDEMKKRYDFFFASQLVSKMHENQLLKDDVLNKLLETK